MSGRRAHMLVSGVVQGVFFRATTQDMARSIGDISGWVRNLPDGRVEVLAEGERTRLDLLVKWLHKGPSGARVDSVDVRWEAATGEYSGFRVTY